MNLQHKANFSLLLLIVIASAPLVCMGQALTAKAHILGSSDKKAYLFIRDSDNRNLLIDSTTSVNDRFLFTHKPEELGYYTITVDQTRGQIGFIWDRDVQIKGENNALWQSKITGSPLTDEFIRYEKEFTDPAREKLIALTIKKRAEGVTPEMLKDFERQEREIIIALDERVESYLQSNPGSFVGLFMLSTVWSRLGVEKTQQLLAVLRPELQAHSLAKAIHEEIELDASVKAGMPAPAFSALDMSGQELSLDKLRGQYVLLDFWGSWCVPCIKLIPETKEAFQKYQGKGVRFIGVAYDKESDREKLNGLIEKNNMTWSQVFQDMSDKSKRPIVESYRVYSYPTIILINPQGEIVFRGGGQNGLAEACKVLDKELN